MFKLPDIKFLEKVVINKDVISRKIDPILIYVDRKVDNINMATNS